MRKHDGQLNTIHVAAVIVRLAKLAGHRGASSQEQPDTSRVLSHASASTSQASGGRHRPRRALAVSPLSHTAAEAPVQPQEGESHTVQQQQQQQQHEAFVSELGERFMRGAGGAPGPRQYANVCWALGQLGYSPSPELSNELAQQLTQGGGSKLQESLPQELASLAHGLARLGYTGGELWSAIATTVEGCLHKLSAAELSAVAWAAATVLCKLPASPPQHTQQSQQQRAAHHNHHHHYHHRSQPHTPAAAAASTSTAATEAGAAVATAFSHAPSQQHQPHQQQLGSLQPKRPHRRPIAAIEEQPQQQGASAVCAVAAEAHQLQHRLRGLLGALAQHTTARADSLPPRELVNVLWACVKGWCPQGPCSELLTAALPHLKSAAAADCLTDQDVGNSAWAYAKAHQVQAGRELLAAFEKLMLRPVPSQPQPPSSSCSSSSSGAQDSVSYPAGGGAATVAAAAGHGQLLLQPQPLQCNRTSSGLSGRTSSRVAWDVAGEGEEQEDDDDEVDVRDPVLPQRPEPVTACSSHEADQPQLITAATTSAPAQHAQHAQRLVLQGYGSQELCNVLWSAATLQHTRSPALVAALVAELRRRATKLQPQGIANVAWAAAKLGLTHAGFYEALLQSAARQVSHIHVGMTEARMRAN